jgi:hypothetical protein
MFTTQEARDLIGAPAYDEAGRQIGTVRAVYLGLARGEAGLIAGKTGLPALAERGASTVELRALGVILLGWLALPLTLCGWVLVACWRLLAAICRLARLAAGGLQAYTNRVKPR